MTTVQTYTKSRIDSTFVAKGQPMPSGKAVTDPVTFQDLIDLGIIAAPTP